MPVKAAGFSVRILNQFDRDKIATLGDLTERTEKDVRRMFNIGQVSFVEIVTKLGQFGLELRAEAPPCNWHA